MSNKREGISKKLRFEVFKRDNFTCQYCGKMAPDVVLEVDHIEPVKGGGKTTIMNLVTSCIECNRGKGARPLTDNQVIKQQQEQLKEINERREQLKLMLKWKKELEKFEMEQVDVIDNMIQVVSDRRLSSVGKENMKKTIKKYGISEVIESTKISISNYFRENDDMAKVINYIPRICATRARQEKDPMFSKKMYIRGILRNKNFYINERILTAIFNEIIEAPEDAEVVINIAKSVRNWTTFLSEVNEYYCSDFQGGD